MLEPDTEATPFTKLRLVLDPNWTGLPELLVTVGWKVPMVLRYDKKAGASKMRVLRTVKDTLKLLARRRLGNMS